MQLVLNELSAEFPLNDEREGKRVMSEFIDTYALASRILKNDRVLLDTNYNGIYLAKNYNIGRWRNDSSVDREQKRIFRSLLNKSLIYENPVKGEDEIKIEGRTAQGALYAYLNKDCLISFTPDAKWTSDTIYADYIELDEEDIRETEVAIPNVANRDTVNSFQRKYKNLLLDDSLDAINVGEDILTHAEDIFANLIFCDTAKRQLKQEKNPVLIRQISKRLLELQKYFESSPGTFDKTKLNHATPESSATLQQYEREHTFHLPSGDYQIFSWHMRFTGSFEGRIFFLPDIPNSKCYIGHIGGKLKNVTYR